MSTPTMNLRDLFEAVLELAAPARAEFLDMHCADVAVRARVESMLRASATDDEPISSARLDGLARAIGDIPALPPTGSRIGPFEILRVIGEGGSSTVFEAHREIEGASQHVALKLLRQSMLSPDARRRFGREQRALIHLQQPNIARMIEGGVTEGGQAYIALELVDGQPITAYADGGKLGVRERLGLFVTVCKAVDAAHRALIVHRDIKPSNVLVTADGEVKLLDFGIAKLLADESEAEATMLPAFTPAYAAPEQAAGGIITTATDVYALGIVLGELLTGVRAGLGASRTPSGSNGAQPGLELGPVTRRRLRGDLDAVVTKAIESDPERRYTSAGALADDIERILDNRPVRAQPQTSWYRMRKFVVRHRGGVASTVAFLLAILASLGIALWQARVAHREAARANTVRGFVESMFQPIRTGLASGRQPSLRDLVDQGAQRIESDDALGSAERVDLLLMFSRLYDYLNEPERMQALANRAGDLADAAFGSGDPLALDAAVARGVAALRGEDHAAAAALLGEAERRLDTARDRGDSWIRVEDGLAAVSNDRGDPAQALVHERAALDARIAHYGEDSGEADGGYANLAYALSGNARFAEAAVAYRRAYAGRVARGNARSARAASSLAALGDVEMMGGELGPARTHLRDALAVFDEIDAGGKASASHLSAIQYHCLVELATGSPLAQAVCVHALDLARTGANATLGRMQWLAGMEHLQSGDLAAARAALESSATLLTDAPLPWQGRSDIARGELALVAGDAKAAAGFLARGVERHGQAYPHYLHGYGLALLALACAEASDATGCAGDTVAAAREVLDKDTYRWNPLLLPAQTALARIDLDAGQVNEAAQRLRIAIGRAGEPVAESQPYLLAAHLWLAVADARAGSCVSAREGARRALELGGRPLSAVHPLHAAAVRAARAAGTCGDLLSAP
ncbi:MAG: serine/threonine-protein kinase [Dokdonella sp.]